ncbi:phytanoyl-CoA dioxygenase family protein [Armatimonas sp.]|uniref:phytanoyl-CoA dioxygenase family protein n=1 Tax=Armatimonas sp. TaxID=1872638 RepID=UPI0037504983
MKNQLSEAQIASYRESGFLVIENFLDANELSHWQKTTQEAVDQRLAMTAAGVTQTETNRILSNQQNPDSYYAQVFTQCIKLLETHAGMKELMLDPRLGELAATLAGIDGIRIWHDQALFKPPFGNPTGWHLDNPYWSFSTRDTLSLWVALDEATLGNGCMWYIPGSHKTATWENAGIGQNMSDLFKLYPQWRTIEPVACPCPAGSAVFHNGLTAHGAGANMTNKPRRAMTCGYLPDGSVFNGTQNILPDDYFHSLKIDDLLNNDTLNPLVWKKPTP